MALGRNDWLYQLIDCSLMTFVVIVDERDEIPAELTTSERTIVWRVVPVSEGLRCGHALQTARKCEVEPPY